MKTRILTAVVLLISAVGCHRRAAHAPSSTPPAARLPSYELRLGKMVFSYYCQTCHGETGAGDGFNAFNLDPKPRDLSDPAFQKSRLDEQLEDAVRRGGKGVGLSTLMPPWGRTLSDRQIAEVVRYVRTLKRAEK